MDVYSSFDYVQTTWSFQKQSKQKFKALPFAETFFFFHHKH